MIAIGEITALLLCAGLSRRFTAGDKLVAPLRGARLVEHPARLIAGLPFGERIAVVPPGATILSELLIRQNIRLIDNPRPQDGKDSSLRIGLAEALKAGPKGVVVLLGDMPNVTADHLAALAAVAEADGQAVISRSGNIQSPPTLIPAERALAVLVDAKRSVRAALGPMLAVEAPLFILADCDDQDDLAREALRTVQ